MKPHTNKLYEPIEILPPCVCPKCFKPTMAYIERDTICAMLDEEGIPNNLACETQMVFYCISCGFSTQDYVITDKGYRYNPFDDAESIKAANRTLSDTRMSGNPFMREF